MVEKGIRRGICQAIIPNIKGNNKYINNYDKRITSSYLQYLDANNLYGWTMCKKLPNAEFNWVDPDAYDEDMIKHYNDNDDYGAILEVDVEYPVMAKIRHQDLGFLPEKRKINGVNKLLTTLEDKDSYATHISTLKKALNHGSKLKKVHRATEFRQKAWMKPYIMKYADLRNNAKNEFEKNFFKLMNNAVFGKTMENVRNHRVIKLVTTDEKRRHYVSEPNFYTSKCFSESLMTIEMKKLQVYMNKPTYLGQVILDLSKTLMFEFYYDYLKPKYKDKVKLCYMDTDSFIMHVETEDFYKDISNDVNEWFDTSRYSKDTDKPIPTGINKKVLGMFKDEVDEDIMTESTNVREKLYAFLREDDKDKVIEKKKTKGTKKCITKKQLVHQDFKDAVLNNKIIKRKQLCFRSDRHWVFTEEINRTAISPNDDKRIQAYGKSTRYQYGTTPIKICESEMLMMMKEYY